MNPDFGQNLGHGPEVVLPTTVPLAERGSKRFPWRSFMGSAILISVGLLAGYVIGETMIPKTSVLYMTKPLIFGAGGATAFLLSTILVSGFNIFREDVNYLFGNGELHPKSPKLLRSG